MRAQIASAALAALTAAAIASGCGGSGADTIPNAVFLKKGNAICLAGLREEAKLIQGLQQAERSAQNPGPGLHEHFVAKVLNAADGMISELSALPLPKGREDAAEEVIEDFESGLEKAKSSPSTYLSGQAFKPAEDAADAYGLAKCAV